MKQSDNQLGRYFQKPNLPIIVWIAATLAAKITDGTAQKLFDDVAFGALFTWAWLEIFQGTNTFRRALGATILGLTLYARLV